MKFDWFNKIDEANSTTAYADIEECQNDGTTGEEERVLMHLAYPLTPPYWAGGTESPLVVPLIIGGNLILALTKSVFYPWDIRYAAGYGAYAITEEFDQEVTWDTKPDVDATPAVAEDTAWVPSAENGYPISGRLLCDAGWDTNAQNVRIDYAMRIMPGLDAYVNADWTALTVYGVELRCKTPLVEEQGLGSGLALDSWFQSTTAVPKGAGIWRKDVWA